MANTETASADLIAGILTQISADMVADAAAKRTRKAASDARFAANVATYKAANIHYGIE